MIAALHKKGTTVKIP
ncbi:hypothetical protein [Buttiauxella selenatireducens]